MTKKQEPADKAPEYISIGEAAERTGLTQRTLRYYEQLGLLRPPARVAGGQRLYSADDLARVEQILRMKKLLGFSLSEIKAAGDSEDAKQALREDLKQERNLKRKLKRTQEAAAITASQVRMVEEKIVQLHQMKKRLSKDLAELNERTAQLEEKIAAAEHDSRTQEGAQVPV